ncbi:MAG TPA: M3 family metallopeptidase [Bacteroidia bacterium]|nr:M3 family metallopeptidase [Bacteroidia bacterium]
MSPRIRPFVFPALVLFASLTVSAGFQLKKDIHPPVSTNNPLMPEPGQVHDFEKVNPEAIHSGAVFMENKVKMLLASVAGVDKSKRTFVNTMEQVDEVYNTLLKAISVFELLGSTHTDKIIRDISGEMQKKFTTKTDELAQDESLYYAVKDYSETEEGKKLAGERAYFMKHLLMEFNLNGMTLPAAKRDSLKILNSRINELSVTFNKNIAADQTTVKLPTATVGGLTPEFLKNYESKEAPGTYIFDLSTPTYSAFMMNCSNGASRKKMYLAKMNLGGRQNEELLVQILQLRTKKAQLLGFRTYAEYATADIMAKNTENVWQFEKSLAKDLREKAQKDLVPLAARKSSNDAQQEDERQFYPYDAPYYSNLVLKESYNVDQEKVKEYFEINNVISGIFAVYQKLYNLNFIRDETPSTWFKDVSAYSVYDKATNERIGYFYLDLFPRENKYRHFGCFPLTGSKKYAHGEKQLRSAALVCNFPPLTADKPSLLPHSQVVTFFHEFGHLMHVILSNTELAAHAGTNVAIDFVEAPSQIMENWAWSPEVLSMFAKHYKSGEIIPDSLVARMIAAKNFNSGLNTLQQVYYGTLDFTLNDRRPPGSADELAGIVATLQNQLTLFPYVEGTHFASSFGHLTGYGSKYYGYLWSLVYAADMFSEFETQGILSPELGARYREKVLARGGSDDAIQLVTDFLGREPNNLAFLRQIGLNQ